jgi:hypothetical protein
MVKLLLICRKIIPTMKKLSFPGIVLLVVICGFYSCQNNPTNGVTDESQTTEVEAEKGMPSIEFEALIYDFGDITQGEKVSYTFAYTNGGDANLILQSATAGCGCTVPKWNKDPLRPGKKGFVEVVFDSSGRKGKQIKRVTIKTNGDPAVVTLQIQANIVEPNS